MTRPQASGWDRFAKETMPLLDPLLAPYLDRLLDGGYPPPAVRWVVALPDGREVDGNFGGWFNPRAPGKATRYTRRDKAERILAHAVREATAWLSDDNSFRDLLAYRSRCELARRLLDARVVPHLQIPGFTP